jgi:methionine synthase I (cobalamin-dependent)
MSTAVTLASQHNEIVSSESYQKAVNDIKEAVNADFFALCRKLHIKPVLDVKYYEKFLDKVIKLQNKKMTKLHAEFPNLVKTVSIGDEHNTTTHTINNTKEFNAIKNEELHDLIELQTNIETVLKAIRKVDNNVTTLVAALPITENQFWNNVRVMIEQVKSDVSHEVFEYINTSFSDVITDKILEENDAGDLIDTNSNDIYTYTESTLNGIINELTYKHINEKSNVIITSIINEYCAKCCNFITQYIINSHSDDFITLLGDLKETVKDIMHSFKFGLKSWIDSCVDLSLIHKFSTIQQVKVVVRSIMQIFNKKVALQANLAYYMEEPLEMIKIEMYVDEPGATVAPNPIVQEIDYEVNGPTIESFVNLLEVDKFYPTSELLAKYVDYFGESVSARAFSDKIKGHLMSGRKQINKVQTRGYTRVNKI